MLSSRLLMLVSITLVLTKFLNQGKFFKKLTILELIWCKEQTRTSEYPTFTHPIFPVLHNSQARFKEHGIVFGGIHCLQDAAQEEDNQSVKQEHQDQETVNLVQK